MSFREGFRRGYANPTGLAAALGRALFMLLITAVVMIISYGFALLGEPQSAWLWCTMAGFC